MKKIIPKIWAKFVILLGLKKYDRKRFDEMPLFYNILARITKGIYMWMNEK